RRRRIGALPASPRRDRVSDAPGRRPLRNAGRTSAEPFGAHTPGGGVDHRRRLAARGRRDGRASNRVGARRATSSARTPRRSPPVIVVLLVLGALLLLANAVFVCGE